MQKLVRIFCTLFAFGLSAASAAPQGFLSNTQYDPSIPTVSSELGFAIGDEIATPEEILEYMKTLAAAAPDKMVLIEYATSWQGRPLVYAAISKPETIARLSEVKADLARLGSGRLSASERARLVESTPAVVWLSYGVHGDEISSPDASLELSYHLLAAENDPVVDKILDETVVIIDPLQNPDGRARFVHSFESSRGLEPQGDRYTAEHDQPWPRGRMNHYLFDMNRDWFAMTQPETKGRIKAMLEWFPVTVVDAHEMGGDQTYFFPPSADPFNPNITAEQRAKQDLFGKNHARWLDPRGIEYFTREIFDAFYPGYGDTWPQLNGAVAMTYEQGSARGLVWTRPDGSELSFKDGVEAHFLTTLSTAQVVADNKNDFLGDYADYRAQSVSEGERSDDRFYVIDLNDRPWQVRELGKRLRAQGIQTGYVSSGSTLCRRTYPRGALVIDRAQPNGRLIKTLLDVDTQLPADFVREQEARRERGERHELYDVTAWSLPLMDGVSSTTCNRVTGITSVVDMPGRPQPAEFGYAVPWTDTGQAKLVVELLKAGAKGKSSIEAFTMEGRTFPRGTVIFSNAANTEVDLAGLMRRISDDLGVEAVSLSSSWTEAGPNLGSGKFRALKMPRIAMGWADGTSALSAGNSRFVLERQLGLPVAPIRLSTMAYADLTQYDVVILPELSGAASSRLGGGGTANLKSFARGGGVVIGFGSALRLLTSEDAGLLSSGLEAATDAVSGSASSSDPVNIEDDAAYAKVVGSPSSRPEDVPGVLLNTIAETSHFLSSGYDGGAVTLLTGREIYTPLKRNTGTNVLRYADPDSLLASGYLWEESKAQLAYKPFLMAERQGNGMVIGFTQSPTTRAYLNGLNLLLLNSVVLAPAMVN
ncbi:MAG: M14 family metallopeptidase [Pseudomonadota bacterium]